MLSATIGGFDGVHIAHQELIKRADLVIIIEKGSSITPGFDRIEYINKPFEFLLLEKIKNLSANEFIKYLKNLNIEKIIIGDDFKFGKNRSGNIELLKNFFEVEVIKEIKLNSQGVHSKKIREFIKAGKIQKANNFLGHTFKIKGTQIRGQGLGSKELFPTININLLKPYILPKPAVYLTLTNNSPSLTFIGIRSTDNNFSIETHILTKWQEKEIIEIEFIDFLRENRKFDNLKELKQQIQSDINTAKKHFDIIS
jgi:riboflavin kinase/FMN adenylyltransferase